MKKILFVFLLSMIAIAVNAATYRVKYDVNNERSTSFVVTVNADQVTINNNRYTLRRLGTITNSGITFNSYCYGAHDGMFCVSTSSISIKKDWLTTISGYIILIDNKPYLADKIN
jgi:hypothetical protein